MANHGFLDITVSILNDIVVIVNSFLKGDGYSTLMVGVSSISTGSIYCKFDMTKPEMFKSTVQILLSCIYLLKFAIVHK